jgi:hypothetical protein
MSERTTSHRLPVDLDSPAPVRSLVSYGRVLLPAPVATGDPTADGTEACWLCGIRMGTSQLVADGTTACADIRWYCRDAAACTERWTSASAGPAGLHGDPAQGSQMAAGYHGTSGPDQGLVPDVDASMAHYRH